MNENELDDLENDYEPSERELMSYLQDNYGPICNGNDLVGAMELDNYLRG